MAPSLLRGVPVFVQSDEMRLLIAKALQDSPRFRPVFTSSWDELQTLCAEPGFYVVSMARLDEGESLSRIRRFELLCPWSRWWS